MAHLALKPTSRAAGGVGRATRRAVQPEGCAVVLAIIVIAMIAALL